MTTIQPTKDFEILAELNAQVQTWHHAHYPDVFKKYDANAVTAFFKQQLNNVDSYAFLATYEDQLCGYILCIQKERSENPFQFEERYLLVDQIGVLPEFQRMGIAQLLMKEAESLANELGCDSLQLNHWLENENASQFFQDAGFVAYNIQMKKKLKK
ncbi:MAG: GNAT family N-acetyltransferase [bacterium]|nr:GNAT family N-acetyltransferase [bacterium]